MFGTKAFLTKEAVGAFDFEVARQKGGAGDTELEATNEVIGAIGVDLTALSAGMDALAFLTKEAAKAFVGADARFADLAVESAR